MNCKFCHAPLDWGQTTCPECGRENPRPPKKKSSKAVWIACAVLLVVVAALVAIVIWKDKGRNTDNEALIFNGTYSEFTIPAKNYTVALEALGATVVATCNEVGLDNTMLSYYYWHAYYNYSSYLAGYVDPSKGLEEQSYGEYTWQQLLLDQALINWEESQALAQEAIKTGRFEEAAQKNLEQTLKNMQDNVAQTDQFETVEEYLQYYYGPQATVESYSAYAKTAQLANLYAQDVASSVEYTDADIDDFYNKNLSTYLNSGIEKSDISNVDVRHILIKPEDKDDDASWEAAQQKAQQIYDEWQAGEKTESSFAALAGEHSEDPGSVSNGGLYTEVAPGQMVEEFDAWCFDQSRQPGDSGIVKTLHGYHIMYFVQQTGTYNWYEQAKSDYGAQQQNDKLLEILKQYQYELDFNKMALISSPLYTG